MQVLCTELDNFNSTPTNSYVLDVHETAAAATMFLF